MKIIFGIIIGYVLSDMISKGVPTVTRFKVSPDWFSMLTPTEIKQVQVNEQMTLEELIQ